MNEQAGKTPIEDLLENVPRGLTVGLYISENCWSNFPVGDMCHEAAEKIWELQRQVASLSDEDNQ